MKLIQKMLMAFFMPVVLLGSGFLIAVLAIPRLTGSVVTAIDDPVLPISSSPLLNEQQRIFSEVYNVVSPAVVAITNSIQATEGGALQPVSTGSGFVIDQEGHIVTNFHVVAEAARLEVSMFDGTITSATLVGGDLDSDLAVIKVDLQPERLTPVIFADSSQLQVGQTVLAIGSPFQNNWTLTSGIISALNRRIIGLSSYSIGGVIQTDAAINPGNSGGPLLNLNGEVIGVNSQINSQTRSSSGVGFSVPSNLVAKVANALITDGEVSYSFIGITSREINLDLIETYSLPNNIRGVAIRQVRPNTPAFSSGLRSISREGVDVITAIDGNPVADFDEMIGYLAMNTNPGDRIVLSVYRNGQYVEIPLTLTSRQ